ncbi:hypothetical protein Fmac_012487 [Flemingia macrophylla]|uniref:Uncharacterized protein n=1 Tax=Flemingia macrophylla TaxID=520843 RepID=A0ABD1MQU1_9FABA
MVPATVCMITKILVCRKLIAKLINKLVGQQEIVELMLASQIQETKIATTITMHASIHDAVGGTMTLVQSSPATWIFALLSNALIFLLGSPILITGLLLSGIVTVFLLGMITWRGFGLVGFLLVATYFFIVSSKSQNLFFCGVLYLRLWR